MILDEIVALASVKSIMFVYLEDTDTTTCYFWKDEHEAWIGRAKGVATEAAFAEAYTKFKSGQWAGVVYE